MTKDEALKLALEALETVRHKIDSYQVNVCDDVDEAITAIREALAQPEQEPVAWKDKTYGNLHHQDFGNSTPLYTTPPHRKPLTDEEITRIGAERQGLHQVARAIEAAHGIKE